MKNKALKKRILEISYKKKLSHLGSCLTAVDIIEEIFSIKKPDEKFVLSSGHAGLALYAVLEKYSHLGKIKFDALMGRYNLMLNAEQIFDHHGVHPDLCDRCGIDCSSGSLGHGLGIAVGMALADRSRNVYCLISDGECAEGSIWEAFRIKREQKLDNLQVHLNDNGWGAYKETSLWTLPNFINWRFTNMKEWPSWLQGQQAHYVSMDEEQYKEALGVVK